MKTVSMQGLLVEVARKFTASPGDLLIVINGVCLGVQETEKKIVSEVPSPVPESILAVIPAGVEKRAIQIGDDLKIARADVAARNILSKLLKEMLGKGQLMKTNESGRIASYRRVKT